MSEVKAWLLKKLTHKKTVPYIKYNIRSIVILRYDRIGDMIVSLPLIHILKQEFTNASISVIASVDNAPIVRQSSAVTNVFVKPKRIPAWLYAFSVVRLQLQHRIDVVIDLNHSVAPHALFTALALNPTHVASPYKDGRWGVEGTALQLYDLMPKQHALKYRRHLSETYLDIARLMGCRTPTVTTYSMKKPEIVKSTEYVVLNHRGSRESMRLEDVDLLRIVRELAILIPSHEIRMHPMANDYKHLQHLMKTEPNVSIAKPTKTIEPVIGSVAYATMVITPDTSLVHIASAFEIPLVAIYANCPALFDQWSPVNRAPTQILFSKSEKGLAGYSIIDLIEKIKLNVSLIH